VKLDDEWPAATTDPGLGRPRAAFHSRRRLPVTLNQQAASITVQPRLRFPPAMGTSS